MWGFVLEEISPVTTIVFPARLARSSFFTTISAIANKLCMYAQNDKSIVGWLEVK